MKYLIGIGFFLFSVFGVPKLYAQPETQIFRDAARSYKQGLQLFEQGVYGKAQVYFAEAMGKKVHAAIHEVPAFQKEAALYYGMAGLHLEQPEAEIFMKNFIRRNQPGRIATLAALETGRFYYAQGDWVRTITYLYEIKPSAMSYLTNAEITELKFKLAYAYFIKKKFDDAELLFQQVKEINSEFYFPSNYYYGIIKFLNKEYAEALTSFQRVERSKRYSTIVPYYICQIYFAKEMYQELIDYATPLLEKTNRPINTSGIQQLLGQAHFEQKAYDKALPNLSAYVESAGQVSKEVLYQLAFTQYKLGLYAEASQNFEQLNRLESALGQNALYNYADCKLRLGDKSAARAAFQLASQQTYDRATQEDATINYAKLSYDLGFDQEAIRTLQGIPLESKYYNEAQNVMSDIFLNTRDYARALATLKKITNKTPQLRETQQKVAYLYGVQQYRDDNFGEAESLFNEAINSGGNLEILALCYYWKAEIHYNRADFPKTITLYNQFLSTAKKVAQLPANSSEGTANYGLGYAYLKKDDYRNAAKYFSQSIRYIDGNKGKINDAYVTTKVLPDALLRAGDCYLAIGGTANYETAAKLYNRVISSGGQGVDYAMYQRSILYELNKDPYSQISLLERILKSYPQSLYADDAQYSLGRAYLKLQKYDLAYDAFLKVEKQYKGSDLLNRTLLKLGAIAYFKGRTEQALEYYKRAYANDPSGETAVDAASSIRDVYIEIGNPDGYFAYMETVNNYQISDLERDSVSYKAALRQYQADDLPAAVSAYNGYLTRFPRGLYHTRAHYERGNAYYRLQRYNDALEDYAFLSDAKAASYQEIANLRAAQISYNNEDYTDALKFYQRLYPLSNSPKRRFEAMEYGLYCAMASESIPLSSVEDFIDNILTSSEAGEDVKARAYYAKGKIALEKNQLPAAKAAFEKNIATTGDDIYKAESRYRIGEIHFKNRAFDTALEYIKGIMPQISSYDLWTVKAVILLGDIYAEKGELTRAKAMFNSIIQNYKGDQSLIDEATQKKRRVEEAERKGSKLKDRNESVEMMDLNE